MVACLGAAVSWLFSRSFFNPVTLTLTLFAVSSYLASLRLFGLFDFPDIAYTIVLVGCIAVFCGGMLANLGDLEPSRNVQLRREIAPERYISYRAANGLALVAIVVLFLTRVAILGVLLSGGGFDAVRAYFLGYSGNLGFVGTTDALLNRLVVSPIMFAGVPVLIYGLLRGEPNRLFTRLMVVAIVLNLATSGGRIIFAYAALQILVLMAVTGARLRIRRRRFLGVVALLGLVIGAVTVMRGNELVYEIYTYLAIPLPLLGHWASQMDAAGVSTNGLSFVYGIVTLIVNALNAFGASASLSVSEAVNAPQDTWVLLLPDRPFNAFVTMFYYFYVDFGIFGVALFGFIFGLVSQFLFCRARRTGDVRTVLILLLVVQAVASSFVRWAGTDGAFVIALILLLALTPRRKRDWLIRRDNLRAPGVSASGSPHG